MRGPAAKAVVAVGRSVPRIELVRPEVWLSGRAIARPVPSSPASPGRLIGVIHAGRNQIKKCSGVALLLPMSGVRRIKRAKRTMPVNRVAQQIETSGLRGEGGELVIPPF